MQSLSLLSALGGSVYSTVSPEGTHTSLTGAGGPHCAACPWTGCWTGRTEAPSLLGHCKPGRRRHWRLKQLSCAKGLEWFQRRGNIRRRSANGTEIGSMVPETDGTQQAARRWKRGGEFRADRQCDSACVCEGHTRGDPSQED